MAGTNAISPPRFVAAVLLLLSVSGCSSSESDALTLGCSKDSDCDSGQECNAKTAKCEASLGNSGGAGGSLSSVAGAGSAGANQNVSAQTQCTTNPQAGCPAGSECLVANASGATSCYGTGSVSLSGACTSINECQSGLLCVYGQCRAQCSGVGDCPSGKYSSCSPYPEHGEAAEIPGSSFCSLQCNPADSSNAAHSPDFAACLPESGCYAIGSAAPVGATSCYSAGTAFKGAACKETGDCRGGLVCLTASAGDATGKCTPYCLKERTHCVTGSCLSFAATKYVAVKGSLVELGYCG